MDSGDTASYSIKSGVGDDTLVSIDSTTGDVTLNSAADYETQSSYTFTVVVTDSGTLTGELSVTVSVTDVNEAPVITSGSSGSVAEGTLVYT
ncbi:MAG: cadherin repeat domain-containing protein, partial [bacterium]